MPEFCAKHQQHHLKLTGVVSRVGCDVLREQSLHDFQHQEFIDRASIIEDEDKRLRAEIDSVSTETDERL